MSSLCVVDVTTPTLNGRYYSACCMLAVSGLPALIPEGGRSQSDWLGAAVLRIGRPRDGGQEQWLSSNKWTKSRLPDDQVKV
jgi:hypothetical protein